jgi:hypothetical protein
MHALVECGGFLAQRLGWVASRHQFFFFFFYLPTLILISKEEEEWKGFETGAGSGSIIFSVGEQLMVFKKKEENVTFKPKRESSHSCDCCCCCFSFHLLHCCATLVIRCPTRPLNPHQSSFTITIIIIIIIFTFLLLLHLTSFDIWLPRRTVKSGAINN